tara:strand:+ start:762 stop:950 length:189 start_codon:yes stop_codon:yes gene_type:complete
MRDRARESLIRALVNDMYWEYDRMSSSGQETLDRIAKLCGVPTNEDMNSLNEHMGEDNAISK